MFARLFSRSTDPLKTLPAGPPPERFNKIVGRELMPVAPLHDEADEEAFADADGDDSLFDEARFDADFEEFDAAASDDEGDDDDAGDEVLAEFDEDDDAVAFEEPVRSDSQFAAVDDNAFDDDAVDSEVVAAATAEAAVEDVAADEDDDLVEAASTDLQADPDLDLDLDDDDDAEHVAALEALEPSKAAVEVDDEADVDEFDGADVFASPRSHIVLSVSTAAAAAAAAFDAARTAAAAEDDDEADDLAADAHAEDNGETELPEADFEEARDEVSALGHDDEAADADEAVDAPVLEALETDDEVSAWAETGDDYDDAVIETAPDAAAETALEAGAEQADTDADTDADDFDIILANTLCESCGRTFEGWIGPNPNCVVEGVQREGWVMATDKGLAVMFLEDDYAALVDASHLDGCGLYEGGAAWSEGFVFNDTESLLAEVELADA